jgi:hypothetical protein
MIVGDPGIEGAIRPTTGTTVAMVDTGIETTRAVQTDIAMRAGALIINPTPESLNRGIRGPS